jgi:flagellar biosynthesis/type III secretory pathway M-ring protein FliF/YscJ
VRNFEVTKVLHRSVEPGLRLSRLSVAVLVDGTWEGEGDARHFVPRSPEELARIRDIVATATGLVDERDRISVECVSFAPVSEVELGSDGSESSLPATWLMALAALLALGAGGAAAVAMRRRTSASRALVAIGEPLSVSVRADPPVPIEDAEVVQTLALDYARRDPELAARVIKGWLAAPVEEPAAASPAAESVEA